MVPMCFAPEDQSSHRLFLLAVVVLVGVRHRLRQATLLVPQGTSAQRASSAHAVPAALRLQLACRFAKFAWLDAMRRASRLAPPHAPNALKGSPLLGQRLQVLVTAYPSPPPPQLSHPLLRTLQLPHAVARHHALQLELQRALLLPALQCPLQAQRQQRPRSLPRRLRLSAAHPSLERSLWPVGIAVGVARSGGASAKKCLLIRTQAFYGLFRGYGAQIVEPWSVL